MDEKILVRSTIGYSSTKITKIYYESSQYQQFEQPMGPRHRQAYNILECQTMMQSQGIIDLLMVVMKKMKVVEKWWAWRIIVRSYYTKETSLGFVALHHISQLIKTYIKFNRIRIIIQHTLILDITHGHNMLLKCNKLLNNKSHHMFMDCNNQQQGLGFVAQGPQDMW